MKTLLFSKILIILMILSYVEKYFQYHKHYSDHTVIRASQSISLAWYTYVDFYILWELPNLNRLSKVYIITLILAIAHENHFLISIFILFCWTIIVPRYLNCVIFLKWLNFTFKVSSSSSFDIRVGCLYFHHYSRYIYII